MGYLGPPFGYQRESTKSKATSPSPSSSPNHGELHRERTFAYVYVRTRTDTLATTPSPCVRTYWGSRDRIPVTSHSVVHTLIWGGHGSSYEKYLLETHRVWIQRQRIHIYIFPTKVTTISSPHFLDMKLLSTLWPSVAVVHQHKELFPTSVLETGVYRGVFANCTAYQRDCWQPRQRSFCVLKGFSPQLEGVPPRSLVSERS